MNCVITCRGAYAAAGGMSTILCVATLRPETGRVSLLVGAGYESTAVSQQGIPLVPSVHLARLEVESASVSTKAPGGTESRVQQQDER